MYVVKKWGAFFLMGTLPTVLAVSGQLFYDLWGLVGGFFLGLLIGILAASLMLNNPFQSMLEGKGILSFVIDSTGVINPFISRVESPYIVGNAGGNKLKDVFDRESVFQMAAPVKTLEPAVRDEFGGVTIKMSEKEFNSGRFALFHYPVILYNGQVRSVITKDWLSDKEKTAFAEHGLLYMNRIVEELSSQTRDFGRYVVEMLKPSGGFGGKWMWIIIIGGLVILAALFAPSILEAIQGTGGAASSAVDTVSGAINSGSIITPMG